MFAPRSAGKTRRFVSEDAIQKLLDVLAFENVPADAVKLAKALKDRCEARPAHFTASTALAALCLQAALEHAKYPMKTLDDIVRRSTIDQKTFMKELQKVKALVDNAATSKLVSITSLCTKYGLMNVEKQMTKIYKEFVFRNPGASASHYAEVVCGVFFVCAKAAGDKSITTRQLVTECSLNSEYFKNVRGCLDSDFTEEIETVAVASGRATPRANRKPLPITPTATTPKTASSRTPSKPPTLHHNHHRASAMAIDEDADAEAALMVIPPQTPQRAASATRTPVKQTTRLLSPSKREGAHTPSHASRLKEAEDEPEDEPATPSQKIARGGFRSKPVTPGTVARNKRNKRTIDEMEEEDVLGPVVKQKRNPFIGRQSLINQGEDAGTSKRCQKADQWLIGIRIKLQAQLACWVAKEAAAISGVVDDIETEAQAITAIEASATQDCKPTSPTPSSTEQDEQRPESEETRESSATVSKPKPKLKKKKPTINTTCCKYDIVRQCSQLKGLRVVDDSEPWTIFWIDTGVSTQRVLEMEPYQKINHFPGMHEICRKDYLARNIGRLSRMVPKEYNFFPKTYNLPHDWADLKIAMKAKPHQTYISKPGHGCQGKGIFLFRSLKAISPHKESKMIVQMYLNKPCLIDRFKFDLRVYVLVTSVNPLRIFVHRDGLARFATHKYVDPSESNLHDVCMHLTNYAINKHSSQFDHTESDDKGSKRTIESVFTRLKERGSIKDPEDLWTKINDAIVKTCVTVQPQLAMILRACFPSGNSKSGANLNSTVEPGGQKAKDQMNAAGSQCFELLGFDIFLDKKLKPWVLEVNHSPSFTCDSPLDLEVKQKVIGDTLGLLNLNALTRKKFEKAEKEKIKTRLFGGGPVASAGVGGRSSTSPTAAAASKDKILSRYSSPKSASSVLLRRDSDDSSTRSTCSLPTSAHPLPQPAKDLIDEYNSTYPASLLDSLKSYEDTHIGSFRRVFPPLDSNPHLLAKYLKCLEAAKKLTPDTVATKGRQEHLRRKAELQQQQVTKLEKWKAGINERGVVRDGSGIVRKVTSKIMSWRSSVEADRESLKPTSSRSNTMFSNSVANSTNGK
ncbi:Tubulin polyglutamylase ttll6 [Podochytrium sp. JEL0797]|nr:Tubulin polyglutamylase ttll6 [Podochytrium sp. JEL0797]